MDFGKIIAVSIKEIWPGEATHFTPWLANNLDVLSEQLDMELVLESTEVAAGDFAADIIAKDISKDQRAVIENQFGNTDHRHLGQIITYASARNAAVWFGSSSRFTPNIKRPSTSLIGIYWSHYVFML